MKKNNLKQNALQWLTTTGSALAHKYPQYVPSTDQVLKMELQPYGLSVIVNV